MRIIYKDAEQAHPVPKQILPGTGPFGRYEPPKAEPYSDTGDFPPGVTAQNGMQEVAQYKCRECGAVVSEYKLESHICEGEV